MRMKWALVEMTQLHDDTVPLESCLIFSKLLASCSCLAAECRPRLGCACCYTDVELGGVAGMPPPVMAHVLQWEALPQNMQSSITVCPA